MKFNSAKLRLATLLGVSLLATSAAAQVAITGFQDNGTDCVTEWTNASEVVLRDQDGLTYTGSTDSNITVHCPMIPPSDDSYEVTGRINPLELHYVAGGGLEAPSFCSVVYRTATGGVFYSPGLVAGTSSTASPFPVLKLAAKYTFPDLPAAIGVQCQAPGGTPLIGILGKAQHNENEGGI